MRTAGCSNAVDGVILINMSLVPNTEFVLIDENDTLEFLTPTQTEIWDMGPDDLECLIGIQEVLLWVHVGNEPLQLVHMPRVMRES